jgi:3D (Asp-Asp-Asp) domain-containing protein|tara:strand:- start:50 stop:574 length:525 start_codon:yes stop_codon:yes gene_type:complete
MKTWQNYLLMSIIILLVNIAGTQKILGYLKERNQEKIESLLAENEELKLELRRYEDTGIAVKVTMYHPVSEQTDSTPNILADGTRIRTQEASNYKFIAVSRNLLSRWGGWLNYGDFILLKGTDNKDGVYQVKDTMHPRWVNRIDILESPGTKPYMFPDAEIVKLAWSSGKHSAN